MSKKKSPEVEVIKIDPKKTSLIDFLRFLVMKNMDYMEVKKSIGSFHTLVAFASSTTKKEIYFKFDLITGEIKDI